MLTPIDIHNRQLKPAKIGGYDKKDIDDFMEEIIASYEELYNENRVLKEKITSLSEGIQYYKKMEGTLQKALVLAEKTSSETQEAAKSQADSVITEASAKAEALSRETKAEIDALRAEAQAQAEVTRAKANRELEETRNHVRKLVQSYENYRLQFKKLAEAQIEMLESDSFSIFVPELDELMNDAPGADTVLDNPGVIPINIGSPAPFEEPPTEEVSASDSTASKVAVQPVEEVPVEPVAKPIEEVPVEPVAKPIEEVPAKSAAASHQKLDVKFDDLSNSIAIPISSNMGPFTDLPEEDTANSGATLQDFKIDSETAPSIDINIGTAIGEEIEVSMSLDPLPASNDIGIDLSVNTDSLLNSSSATVEPQIPEQQPAVEQVDISASTAEQVDISGSVAAEPIDISGSVAAEPAVSLETGAMAEQPAMIPVSIEPSLAQEPVSIQAAPEQPAVEPMAVQLSGEPSVAEPDVLELVPEQPAVSQEIPVAVETAVSMTEPPVSIEPSLTQEPASIPTSAEPFVGEPNVVELAMDQPAVSGNALIDSTEEPQDMNIPLNFESPADMQAEPQGMNIPLNFESPADMAAEPQSTNIPLNFESSADMAAEPQGMNIPLNFESPTDMAAEPQGMNIPLNFESPADMQAEPQGMNIPLNFESPTDMAAEPQGMNIPLNFESPADMAAEPQGMNIPLNFESPTDIQAEPQGTSIPLAFESPENMMADNPAAMPATDIPMMETPPMMEQAAPETQQPSINGLIGAEPTDSAANANPNSFLDMSNMFDSPVQDMPAETEQTDIPVAQEAVNPAPSDNNGIISDAFIDPTAMFESPIQDAPAEQAQPAQPAQTSPNPNDAMLEINPFNFIDPE